VRHNLGERSQSEVIVTNQPIPDGTIFIAKTGSLEQKMVVLREEYYQSLVNQIEIDHKHSIKSRTLKNKRSNSMERNNFRASLNGVRLNKPSPRTDYMQHHRSTRIQDFNNIYQEKME
jgi:5-methylcytosine-specific restriction endonuclease McrA